MLTVSVAKRRGDFLLEAAFELPTPGVVALFGRSGSGKSTLINVIAGLLQADAGRISLDDAVLQDSVQGVFVPPERRRIGYVFQDARLFPHLSVEGNLRYGARRARGRPFVGFDEVTALLGLGMLMNRRVHQLSGGEQQRIAIGRALLSQPRLLLLDEPLASLDAARREEVLPYLENLRDRLAIPMVYVSHDFDEVLRLASHIVLMDAGRAVAGGGVAAMSLNPALRRIIGPDAVGAVVDGSVVAREPHSGLMNIKVGAGHLWVQARDAPDDAPMRVQLLARDLIVATEPPRNTSARNQLRGVVASVTDDAGDSDLIAIDIGGALIMARVTHASTRELSLETGMAVWVLVKSVSLRCRPIGVPPRPPASPHA